MSAEFLKDELGITRLDRLDDGRVMCCLCFSFFEHDGLNQVAPFLDGSREDVCHRCAEEEKEHMRRYAR